MAIRLQRHDVMGGLTAAVVALPLALAFGVASGAGALAGLYGAVFVGFFAAVFGGTPAQISGPTGPMTVVMALVVSHFAADPGHAFLVVALGGLLQVAFGYSGIGRYIKLVPYPVVSGFMNGIGCIIIILQVPPLLGYATPDGIILVKLAAMPAMFAAPDLATVFLGLFTLAVMLLTPRALRAWLPPPLLALVAGTAVSMLALPDVPVIGAIPTGLPHLAPGLPPLDEFPYVVRYAIVLAFLGSIDSLLTSLVADGMTNTRHDSDRELVGQGIGNFVAGLFGGLPGAGATMRTVVNVRAGGRGPVSGATHALVLAALVLGIGGAVARVPLAVLAGILFKVGIDIIDWRYVRRLHRAPRAGVVIMLTTLGITVFVDLITAVAVGVVMACVLFVARMADAQMESARLAFDPAELPGLDAEETALLAAGGGRVLLFSIEGPLSFGSAKDIAFKLRSGLEHDVLVIDMSSVPFIDSTASLALEEVIEAMDAAGNAVLLCATRPRVADVLERCGVLARLGAGNLCDDRRAALARAVERLAELDRVP
ncbi:MAG: SulP family inorganic anion transporter [Gammaproteobacteria bacterium]|nr:SulP family inorganic anion transporter [Gammaproteobacteria bacterium]